MIKHIYAIELCTVLYIYAQQSTQGNEYLWNLQDLSKFSGFYQSWFSDFYLHSSYVRSTMGK